MLKIENKEIIVMDFSGIYRREQVCGGRVSWVEARDIPGTNCYCDAQAAECLRRRIGKFPAGGIHLLDSGNYHYMSRLWLEKIKRPFRLLVFDNHTDMQPPAFGGLLSCGGWIADAMEALNYLREVILVGPDGKAFLSADAKLRRRARFLSREELADKAPAEGLHGNFGDWSEGGNSCLAGKRTRQFFAQLPTDLPLYLSIDKDILCPGEAHTAWSQGDVTLRELLFLLGLTVERVNQGNGEILGIDICGECDAKENTNGRANEKANRELVGFFRGLNPETGKEV